MGKNRVVIVLLSVILSSAVCAGSMGVEIESDSCWAVAGSCWGTPEHDPYRATRVITLSAGPGWSRSSTNQQFFLQPDIQKTYETSLTDTLLGSGSLFYGMQKQFNSIFYGQLGIVLAASGSAKLEGLIWEDTNQQVSNFSYKYKVAHAHMALKGELLADVKHRIRPYVNASIGAGINRAYDYTIQPVTFGDISAPAFTSNNTVAFTYTLGLGVKKDLNEHWQVGVGYEFASWGKSQLAPAYGQTFNTGLLLDSLYTDSLLFSISFMG